MPKKGRKPKESLTRIVYKNYWLKMEDNCFVLYKQGNPHPIGYFTDIIQGIKNIIEDKIRNRGVVMELQEYINEYRQMKEEILGLLN